MIHSSLLSQVPNLSHGFTTLGTPGFDTLNARTATVKQVHGKSVEWTESLRKAFAEADALGTFHRNLPVGVFTADCTPILMAALDRNGSAFAVIAVHAGWKGAAQEIARIALRQLAETAGVRLHEVVAALGPAISQQRFEVGQDVVDAFPGCLARGMALPHENGKFWFDLQGENRRQLETAAQELEVALRCDVSPHCTWSEPTLFPSWRRDRERASRMLSWLAFT
ncbi:MAG: polyphenol oxidase family protein [Bdellovibrionales bacterium]|nr:polyphenol oxidase family protein [Bdellovibrionales bacterium]